MQDQNALSVRDKLSYGIIDKDTADKDAIAALKDPKTSEKLAEKIAKDGPNNSRSLYQKEFFERVIDNLKKYSEVDNLGNRDDEVSKLVKTRLEGLFNRLDLLTDDKKLQDYSGIDFTMKKEFDREVRKKLLPDIDENKGSSWWGRSDQEIMKEMQKRKTPKFDYVRRSLQLSPTEYMGDPQNHYQIELLNNPYTSLSDTMKDVLGSYQEQIKKIVSQDKSLQTDFVLNNLLNNEGLFGNEKEQAQRKRGIKGLTGVTDLNGPVPTTVESFQPRGKKIIDVLADSGPGFNFSEFADNILGSSNRNAHFQSTLLDGFAAGKVPNLTGTDGEAWKAPDFNTDSQALRGLPRGAGASKSEEKTESSALKDAPRGSGAPYGSSFYASSSSHPVYPVTPRYYGPGFQPSFGAYGYPGFGVSPFLFF